MSRTSASLVAVAAALLSQTVATQTYDWEPIRPDLRNVRGMCYLPTYPSLNGSPNYYGVASSTAMWNHYDAHPNAIPRTPGATPQGTAGSVYTQLLWQKKMGVNTVRIWLSFPLWEWYDDNPTTPENPYIAKVRHFVQTCKKLKIRVMPVLWDSLSFRDPDYSDPLGITTAAYWHGNPGDARVSSFVAQSRTLAGTKAERYVLDMMQGFDEPEVLLMWDIMNEPHTNPDIADFIQGTMAIIKRTRPSDMTNIGLLWADDRFPLHGIIARDPNLDSFAIHPYGHTRANIEAHLWDTFNIPDGNGGFLSKPVIATEIGKPGWALEYQDALDYAIGVPRPDLGPGETGIGFTPWTTMIGWEGGQFPFMATDGIFFADGQVRERDVVLKFMQIARSQGVPSDQLWNRDDIVEFSGTGRIVQNLGTHIDDFDYLATQLWLPPSSYANFTWQEFTETCGVFRMVSFFIDPGPISYANNPINDPTIPGNVIAPNDRQVMLWSTDWLCPPNEPGVISPQLRGLLSAIIGEPFLPETNSMHRSLLSSALLDRWRLAILPYVAIRGGPY